MKKQLITLVGLSALAVSLSSQASSIATGYGVYASTSTASSCPSYCTGDFQYDSAGTEFSNTASASQNTYAAADAFASLSGSSFLPILKAKTSATDGVGGFATAFGVQGFTYTGTDIFDFTLNYNLHGSAGLNPTGSTNTSNSLSASIAVLVGNGDLEWYPDFGTLVYEVAYNQRIVGTDDLSIFNATNVNTPGSISFSLNPGDDFYVVGSMSARSINGYADGWNTLTFDFTDDTGLTAATSVVPVPAAAWLFASGLIGLASVARRKKS